MTTPVRVLVVEDSEDDALLLIQELRQGGYEPAWVRVDSATALTEALDSQWDLILADYSLPSFSGPAALELLKARGTDVPMIMVSGMVSEETAVESLHAGARDFIPKGQPPPAGAGGETRGVGGGEPHGTAQGGGGPPRERSDATRLLRQLSQPDGHRRAPRR